MLRMSEHFAARLKSQSPHVKDQITLAFRLALCRSPTGEELTVTVAYAERFGLTNACRVILNLNEFAFVD
jgi:hypothetical protein